MYTIPRIVTSKPPTVTAQVEQFLEGNSPSSVRNIAKFLGVNTNTIRTVLARLHGRGIARQCKDGLIPGVQWEIGCDENIVLDDEPPKRERITSWEPHHVRDELVTALFGQKFHQERESA